MRDGLQLHWGLIRRNVAERRWALRMRGRVQQVGPADPPQRPIFIVGCPRSGTTLVFALLRRHDGLKSLPHEGHALWNLYQHPWLKGWSSDRATGEDVRPGEPGYLYGAIRELGGRDRFLDKTPKNVLKIPYLVSLFPDARFVFVKRDPRDTVSSLIEGWLSRRGISYRLPERLRLAEYRGRLWSYILPPAWRSKAKTSVAEVAAFQYAVSICTALEDARALPTGSLVEVPFEDLLSDPVQQARLLIDRLELPASQEVLDFAADITRYPVGTVSPPAPGKWRRHAREIARVWPTLAPAATRLGYDVEVPV